MIFETHAHYDDAKFDTDREMLLADLPQRGISPVINVGSSIATTKTTLSLAQEYPFLYAAVGVHPSDVDDLNEDTYAWLRQQTTLQKTVAVGEIGLDYYWDKEPEIQAKQRYWFVRQLALAQQADLPVIIHSRDAAEDTMKIMEKAYEVGIKVLETDCPYMAPEPRRGTRNDSRNIPYVIAKIAEIKGISPEEVEQTTRENAFALFTKVPR